MKPAEQVQKKTKVTSLRLDHDTQAMLDTAKEAGMKPNGLINAAIRRMVPELLAERARALLAATATPQTPPRPQGPGDLARRIAAGVAARKRGGPKR
ncbi:MAG: hypothetical protein J0L84_18255 [Verrucomicrobia bacterium]|nr:hypothetical protein [Verrucomicrobiota bacterium]